MRTKGSKRMRLLALLAGISATALLTAPSVFAANTEFLPDFAVETLTPASQATFAWQNVAPNALAGYYTYMPLTAADAALAGFPAAAGCDIAPAGTSDCYIITAKKLLQPMSLDFLNITGLTAVSGANLFPGPGLISADGITPLVDQKSAAGLLGSAGLTTAWGYGSGGVNWKPFGATGPTLSRGNAPSVFQNTPIGLTTFKTDGTGTEGAGVTGVWHFPAPTIKGTTNRPVNVLWLHEVPNEKPLGFDPSIDCGTVAHFCYPYNRIVLHVHGAHVGPESDGLATSWFSPVYTLANGRLNGEDSFVNGVNAWDSYQFKTVQNAALSIPAPYLGLPIYHYPMTQPAGTIWYHDHAIGATHTNTEMGMAGFFPVTDAVEKALQTVQAPATLPVLPTTTAADVTNTFSTYDVGLALQDRHFDVNGQMAFPAIASYDKNDPNCVFDANNNAIPGTCKRLDWMKKINPASATDPDPKVHFVAYVPGAPEVTNPSDPSYALNFPTGCQVNLVNNLENVAGVDPVTGSRVTFTQCAPFPATSATLEYFGNMPVVNGVTYAVYDVEPTVYRFRMIGGNDSRTWIAQLVKGNATPSMVNCGGIDPVTGVAGAPAGCAVYPAASIVPFYQVGTEQGLLTNMVKRNELDIMDGERVDVLVDFTGLGGQTITMKNLGDDAPYSGRFDFDNIDVRQPTSVTIPEIMKFRVKAGTVAASAQTPVDGKPLAGVTYPSTAPGNPDYRSLTPAVTRTIALIEITDQYGRTMPTIDARGFVPPGIRTTEIMQQNVVEQWDIVNTTVDAHPMHIHQVAFLPIDRQAIALNPDGSPAASGFKAAFNNGLNYFAVEDHSDAFRQSKVFTESQYIPDPASSPIPVAAYDAGLKDTIQIPPGYVSRNKIVFDILGDYVWHCHILSHEEHDMMRPYRITNATPMPAPASVTVSGADALGNVTVTIPPMVGAPPATQYVVQYRKVGATFWETNGQLTATQTVNVSAIGTGIYEFRAQIIEPALQSQHVLTRPNSAWTAGATTTTFVPVTPAAGSVLTGATQAFSWSAYPNATLYQLWVGTTAGSNNLGMFPSAASAATSTTVTGLPTNGSPVFVRLYALVGSSWQFVDYTYTAYTTPVPSTMLPSVPATIAGGTQTFSWANTGASLYQLWIGTTGAGSSDLGLHPNPASTATSFVATGLPTTGTIFVRLYSLVGGSWQFNDYSYPAIP